jgi:hypothetical protein
LVHHQAVIIGGVASLGISLLLYPCVRLKLRSKFDVSCLPRCRRAACSCV